MFLYQLFQQIYKLEMFHLYSFYYILLNKLSQSYYSLSSIDYVPHNTHVRLSLLGRIFYIFKPTNIHISPCNFFDSALFFCTCPHQTTSLIFAKIDNTTGISVQILYHKNYFRTKFFKKFFLRILPLHVREHFNAFCQHTQYVKRSFVHMSFARRFGWFAVSS